MTKQNRPILWFIFFMNSWIWVGFHLLHLSPANASVTCSLAVQECGALERESLSPNAQGVFYRASDPKQDTLSQARTLALGPTHSHMTDSGQLLGGKSVEWHRGRKQDVKPTPMTSLVNDKLNDSLGRASVDFDTVLNSRLPTTDESFNLPLDSWHNHQLGIFLSHEFSTRYAQDIPPEHSTESDDIPSDDTLADPELGVLRLIEVPVDSVEILDPELGVLRLQELPTATNESSPSVYLQVYSNFFWTDNVLSVVDDPIDDGIFQIGLSLSAFPALGSRTYLISSIGGDLVRYTDETDLDYNDLSFDLGVYHAFTRRAYLELGWNNNQFFDRASGDRFLNDHSFYVSVGRRDRLSSRLSLDTEYQLEYNLADPVSRNRAINQIRASLEYQITPRLETDVSYRFTLVDFTKQDRNDFFHQFILGLNYDLSADSQISFFGGGRLGDSSENFLDFDSALVGVSISVNLSLF